MMIAETKNTLCTELIRVGAGKGEYLNVPNIEQWFDAVVLFESAPTTGDITFGAMVQIGGEQYYPAANHGYKTVGFAALPIKTGTPPFKCVVSFFGQPTSGCLGIINNADADISVRINASYRVIRDEKEVQVRR